VTILRTGSSTFIRAAAPSKSYGQAARLNLHADNPVGTGEFVYLQFGLPKDLHKGATVTSAHLRVQQDGDWTPTGPRTLTKQRINAKWLLSTIKWVNRPGLVTGTDVALTQSTVGDLAVWDWDVTTDVQAWVNGAPNYGWRIIADVTSTRYLRGFTAKVGRPALVVEYAYPPAVPTSLHPSAGAVSVSKPVVRFDTGDITAVNVQVDPAAAATPAFDSGWVTTTANELNLAATAYAGLAVGASTQWRVRVRNDVSVAPSSWSQWVTFSRVAKPALTITQPTGTVLESTPPITWTMTGMVEWQVTVALASKPSVIIHDSGRKPGTSPGAYTPPKPVFTKNGAAYLITVGGWDAVDREYTTGDPRRSEATTTAVLTDDPGIVAVDWITAQQQTNAPWVDLVWQRPAMPDGWIVVRDGEWIYDTHTAGDLNVSGTTYTFRDWTAAPNREHVYRVAPIENGVNGRGGPTDTVVPEIKGIWLGDPDTGDEVMLFGNDDPEPEYGEEVDTFTGIGATSSIDVLTALRGWEAPITGLLTDALDRTAVDDLDTMYRWKGDRTRELRLAWADVNVPGTIGNVQLPPRRVGTTPYGVTRGVSFQFKQTGELPFDTDL
jgi:hypothetical protein